MTTLPNGVVTFLMSDVEESTLLWHDYRDTMPKAIEQHDSLFANLITQGGGVLVKPRGEGDSHFAVFGRPRNAVITAASLQRALIQQHWPGDVYLRVRIAVHTGETELRAGDYYGLPPNRCGRLRSMAHGRQILLSRATFELVVDSLPDGLALRSLGSHRLRGLERTEEVWQLCGVGLPEDFPPLASMGPAAHDVVTILVSDLVGAMQLASELGNRRLREWLDLHDEIVRVELQRFGGRLWLLAEDTFVASFESARRAVDCACAIRDGVTALGGNLRLTLHAGEVEVRGDRIHGLAVDIATRMLELADSGEILLSRTVSDLLVRSEIQLDDRGAASLRGLSGQWHLYAVTG